MLILQSCIVFLLILQSCANSPKALVGLHNDKSATMSGDVRGRIKMAVGATDLDVMIVEMPMVKIEDDAFMDMKEEEFLKRTREENFHVDVTSHTVKTEQDKVSHICFSIIRYIL
jgi:hypothetical protein